ncbi:hypothetical protein EOD23_35715, partial [Mesorhizobium sp. USDA-HM6]
PSIAGGTAPPLSCRTSPPQGGRLDVISAFANRLGSRISAVDEPADLLLAGEMAGRPEGGNSTFPFESPEVLHATLCHHYHRRRRRRDYQRHRRV